MSYKGLANVPTETPYLVAATLAAGILANRPLATPEIAAEIFWECLYETFPTAPGHMVRAKEQGSDSEHRLSEDGPLSGGYESP